MVVLRGGALRGATVPAAAPGWWERGAGGGGGDGLACSLAHCCSAPLPLPLPPPPPPACLQWGNQSTHGITDQLALNLLFEEGLGMAKSGEPREKERRGAAAARGRDGAAAAAAGLLPLEVQQSCVGPGASRSIIISSSSGSS